MSTNFDEVINRFWTNCVKWDGLVAEYGQEVIPLSVADMDLRAPQAIVDEAVRMAQHGIFGYTELYPPYFEAVQGWMKRAYTWDIPQEWIVFSPRIVQAFSIILQKFTDIGDRVLMHTPAYQPIAKAITENDREYVESPLIYRNGRYEMDFDDMERHMKKGIKLLLLCSPHNPTGRVWNSLELARLADLCTLYDVLIVSDDIHADFIRSGHEHTVIAKLSERIAQRSIICTSPSKTFNLASLEIANIIIPNENLRAKFKKGLIEAGIHNPTFFAVPICETAYTACDGWLEEVKSYIEGNIHFVKQFFAKHFPELHVVEPEGTYLLWIDCTSFDKKDEKLKRWILDESKVSVSFGTSFGTQGEGFIRLNVATSRVTLEEALQRMAVTYQSMQ
ncbi:MalY/PatB family protein [Paenibacillus macquariensis]|uniref:cysteine-S-conjugate beta-lyase n=1 Tax=Paenibacillus macquariensis TaxID=948756 RepID=A0ABY1K3C8_9BACL|nr:MalY/PatB family protein [Paenibacillus macquariensis]MEC0090363.1 pyridoxal phosphate-dependent aminotransferase [Paenibacillus macquariensis]OAB39716.1 aminotransferase class I/II [Paenibacillus macquariensis subsp. macquariensis]SIR19974.1 cystathione beta-lyase [Paenibacillus macquariensis]